MLEKYIDDFGRAYSPSMASQYSPPQRPLEDEMLFIQPPPLVTGPAPMASPFPPHYGQWVPFPPPPIPHGNEVSSPHFGQHFSAPGSQQQPPLPFQQEMGQAGLVPVSYAALDSAKHN